MHCMYGMLVQTCFVEDVGLCFVVRCCCSALSCTTVSSCTTYCCHLRSCNNCMTIIAAPMHLIIIHHVALTRPSFQACCATLGTCQHLSLPGQHTVCMSLRRCYQCRDWCCQSFGHPSLASNTSKHVMLELISALINLVCVCCQNQRHAPVSCWTCLWNHHVWFLLHACVRPCCVMVSIY